ncbi:MAG: hypothetical protein JWQ09_6002 [Segetibacter sp.]|nr:hypothetical protein [Segetibacter sp.]
MAVIKLCSNAGFWYLAVPLQTLQAIQTDTKIEYLEDMLRHFGQGKLGKLKWPIVIKMKRRYGAQPLSGGIEKTNF